MKSKSLHILSHLICIALKINVANVSGCQKKGDACIKFPYWMPFHLSVRSRQIENHSEIGTEQANKQRTAILRKSFDGKGAPGRN